MLTVLFQPVDRHNPRFGYNLHIENARTGVTILRTSKAPDTGYPLMTAADCMRVVQMYIPSEVQ